MVVCGARGVPPRAAGRPGRGTSRGPRTGPCSTAPFLRRGDQGLGPMRARSTSSGITPPFDPESTPGASRRPTRRGGPLFRPCGLRAPTRRGGLGRAPCRGAVGPGSAIFPLRRGRRDRFPTAPAHLLLMAIVATPPSLCKRLFPFSTREEAGCFASADERREGESTWVRRKKPQDRRGRQAESPPTGDGTRRALRDRHGTEKSDLDEREPTMLVLSRKLGEKVMIKGIVLTVVKVDRNQVRLGIERPRRFGSSATRSPPWRSGRPKSRRVSPDLPRGPDRASERATAAAVWPG